MQPSSSRTGYEWLWVFYLVLAVVWLAIGIARLLTDGGWFGWASLVLGLGFGIPSVLWFRKTRSRG
jgi:uncharacterized membrane protein